MAFFTTQGCGDTSGDEDITEGVLLGFARAGPGQSIDGVVWDQIDFSMDGSGALGQHPRLIQHVVDAFDENVFQSDVLLTLGAPILQGVEKLGQVVLVIHRHDLTAHLVTGSV